MAVNAFCAIGSICPKKSSPKRMREMSMEMPSCGWRRKNFEKRSQSVFMARCEPTKGGTPRKIPEGGKIRGCGEIAELLPDRAVYGIFAFPPSVISVSGTNRVPDARNHA